MGAWIEIPYVTAHSCGKVSHPTWVRGLKYNFNLFVFGKGKSHPTWVRGLKLLIWPPLWKMAWVAPHVGAWIEIPRKHEQRL